MSVIYTLNLRRSALSVLFILNRRSVFGVIITLIIRFMRNFNA